jgi:hypothetical protein
MALNALVQMRASQSLQHRIAACAAKEGEHNAAEQWAYANMWQIVTQPGWEVEWERGMKQADDQKFNPDIGARPDIITDIMILSAVQLVRTPPA